MRDHNRDRRRADDCTGEGSQSVGSRDRAQLVLVAGFVLAVTFVALALLLNTAIFAENLATRQTGGDAASAEKTISTVDTSVGRILTYVNKNNTEDTDYVTLETRFEDSVANWTDTSNHQLVVNGQRIQVEEVGTTEGTRMVHTNASRSWTSANEDPSWTLFQNVDAEEVRWFELNISRKSLADSTLDTGLTALLDSAYNVRIENSTGRVWQVYVFEGAATGNVYTLVEEPDDPNFENNLTSYVEFAQHACLVNAEHVEIDLWASEVQDIPCDELEFTQNLSGEITVRYENVTSDTLLNTDLVGGPVKRVNGTYDILVNSTNVIGSNFHDASMDESPFTLTALGGATIRRSYGRENLNFTGTTQVKPASFGGLGAADRPVVKFYVNDSSSLVNGNPEFHVNWDVRDPDGNLKWVNVTIEDDDGVLETYANYVGGSEANGTNSWKDSDINNPYTITVVVKDQEGNTDSATQEHDADGIDEEPTLV